MRDIWAKKGRKLETLIFDNNPKNIRTQGDIKSKDGVELPTLYYMFGKANDKEHSFVVTDEDMLAFCQSWLTESVRPEKLSREIGEKFLLFLGCNYPDWLVRFIWYSMRKNLNKSGMLVDDCAEDSLVAFLNRVNVKTQKNIEYVVSQIENRIEKIEQRSKAKFQTPQEKTDVFISYSRTNEKEARSLYDALTARGLNVWYDREKLNLGDDWFVKIKKSIESTKFFVALLSADMKEQVNDSKVYRKEWNIAIDHARGMSPGRGFIIPICIGEVDMLYKDELDIPMELVAHNATTLKKLNEYDENQKFKTLNISEKEDYDNIADKIIKRLDDLF